MVDQGLLETNLLQLFAHPESSEWFSIISVIIFEVKIVTEQKEAQLVTIFFVFLYVSIALNFFAAPPCLTASPAPCFSFCPAKVFCFLHQQSLAPFQ